MDTHGFTTVCSFISLVGCNLRPVAAPRGWRQRRALQHGQSRDDPSMFLGDKTYTLGGQRGQA